MHLGARQARFWRGLGPSWEPLGRFVDLLGTLGRVLGASWARLGCLLGSLGRLLGALGCLLCASWLSRTLPDSILECLGLDFGMLGARFWPPLCLSLHNAGVAARDPSWHSLRLFFSYLQRGGTCAAHGIGRKTYKSQPLSPPPEPS